MKRSRPVGPPTPETGPKEEASTTESPAWSRANWMFLGVCLTKRVSVKVIWVPSGPVIVGSPMTTVVGSS